MARKVSRDGTIEVTVPGKVLAKKLAKFEEAQETARESTMRYGASLGKWAPFVERAYDAAIGAFKHPASILCRMPNVGESRTGCLSTQQVRMQFASLSKRARAGEVDRAWLFRERPQDAPERERGQHPIAVMDSEGLWSLEDGKPMSSANWERALVEAGLVDSSESLRAAIGLDFPQPLGNTVASLEDTQSQKYLRDALCREPAEGEGVPSCPDELAQALGRGLVTRHELSFVIDGIERSRQTGSYEIATEHTDRFGNLDVLVHGEGISRAKSTSAEAHARMQEQAQAVVDRQADIGDMGTVDGYGLYPEGGDVSESEEMEL